MNYFVSKRALPNYIIWFITLVPSYIIKYGAYVEKEGDATYIIFEGLSWLLLTILLTSGIQVALERISGKKDELLVRIIKFVGLLIIATFIFNLIIWPLLDFIYDAVYQGSKQPDYGKVPTNIFNIFIWVIWFISLSLMVLTREVREARIRNAELEAHLKAAQLNTLKGQINPHFMFNSLNNIRGLMLEDVNKAREMLTNLSETLRYSLTKSGVNSIALEDELDMVNNYVEVSKIQFEDRLRFKTQIDQNSLSKQIPPMIIQMLVENAIKHGISNLKDGGDITLTTVIDEDQLKIEVMNSGVLQLVNNTTQVGLNNIKERLELLYGAAATFSLKETADNQVVATIKIPLA